MNSMASKELKLEIFQLYENYTQDLLNTKTALEKKTIQQKINVIGAVIKNATEPYVYCPNTGKLLKQKNKTSLYYKTVNTCGHCSECLKVFYFAELAGNFEKSSWPVCFIGKGVVCKNCMEK